MLYAIIGLLILLLVVGLLLLRASQQTHESTGMPEGEVVYDDSGAWEKQEQPLLSRRYGLVGRPDYLVTVTEKIDRRNQQIIIPVEVKSRKRPPQPYDSQIKIPYTESLRNRVLAAAEAIRKARRAPTVDRSHDQFGRCRGCGYRDACGDAAL